LCCPAVVDRRDASKQIHMQWNVKIRFGCVGVGAVSDGAGSNFTFIFIAHGVACITVSLENPNKKKR